MRRSDFFNTLLIVFLFFCFLGAQDIVAKTLYDDFSGDNLDSAKWIEGELVRKVSQGKLVFEVNNSANLGVVRERVPFVNPSSIDTIECDVVVSTATLDSGANPESFARIDGRFYKAQISTTEKGDIWAGLYLGDRGNGLEAWWAVREATDDEGNTWDDKGSGSLNVPGLSYGQSYTIKIDYHDDNQFTFTVAGVSETFTGPARQDQEYTQYKALEVIVSGASGNGYVSAAFDNVLTNGTAYDNFSTVPLDHSKWQTLEAVRKIENGKVQLTSRSAGDRANTRLNFSQISPYTEATIRVDSSSNIAPGDRGIARIDGYYYNDTYGPGNYNGYEGNVWVGFYLNYYSDGTLTAACSGDKTLDADDTQWENLFYREFNLPIVLDRDYKMAIHFTGTALRFIIKDTVTGRMDVYGYDITTAVYEPYDEYRTLLSRVYGDSTGGYMVVEVDDIYVDVAEPAATFDASGNWELTVSDFWDNSGCGLPDASDADITITQSGNDFTLVVQDDENTTLSGKVYGDTYGFKDTEEDNDETEIFYGIFTLSQETSGAGNVTFIWFDDVDYCESGFGITINKKATGGDGGDDGGGGGGGCFVKTLIH